MNEKELRRLGRQELLVMLLSQSQKVEKLTEQLNEAQEQLREREITLSGAGSIAKAALELNGVFDTAQAAADQYLENVRRLIKDAENVCARKTEEAEQLYEEKKAEAEMILQQAENVQTETARNSAEQMKKTEGECRRKLEQTERECRQKTEQTEEECREKIRITEAECQKKIALTEKEVTEYMERSKQHITKYIVNVRRLLHKKMGEYPEFDDILTELKKERLETSEKIEKH